MGKGNGVPRSTLKSEKTTHPELGARHPLVETDELEFFFADLTDIVLENHISKRITQDRKGRDRVKRRFRVYDDPDRLGISILERRLSRRYGQKHRLQWTRQDVGRIRGEIENTIGRMELGGLPLKASMTEVVRLGSIDASEEQDPGRKLALIVDQSSPVAEFLVAEHEAAIDGIQTSLSRFRYPYSSFIPHLTVASIDRSVPDEEIGKSIKGIRHLLPLEIEMHPIKFTSHQEL